MKRITTIFDFSSGKLTGAESLPGRAWGASVVVGTLAVCLAMSLGLTFRVTAGEEGGDASVQAESPEAKQARIQKERSPRTAVERFDAERAKERAELIGRGVTDAELDAAEKKVREAQAGFDTGQVGIAELSEAKRKLAERRLVQSGDQKYADEIVACYKNALDMVQAQFDAAHPDGTSRNLAEAKVKYYNAKMTFAPFGSPVNFEDAEKILAAADDLGRSAQCEFDNGKMSLADLTEVNARAEKIRATYQPILAERTAN